MAIDFHIESKLKGRKQNGAYFAEGEEKYISAPN